MRTTKKRTPRYPRVVVQLSGMGSDPSLHIARVKSQLRAQASVSKDVLDRFVRQARRCPNDTDLRIYLEEWVHVI